jgi:predicted aldo/keto reductase-like oxidoreductase
MVDGLDKLPKRRLGTRLGDMKVTPICISQDWHSELFAPAIAVGINFIHKAGYWGNLPEEIKALPRESYYTDATVDSTSPGHDPDNYDEAYNQVVSSLDKNGLKYYDIYRAHYGWHTPEKIMQANNTSYKVFQRLKKEGKVRYFGVSQHPYNGPSEEIPNYPQIIQAVIDSGIIDSMQVWYSYGYPAEVREIFAKASKAGIAMTAMKVNAHGRGKMAADPARMKELKADGMPGRAVLRDVLTTKRADNRPIFQTCVSNIGNMQQFEENVGAVSSKVARIDGFTEFNELIA